MFHREPGDDPTRDNVLQPGELITAVRLPAPTGGAKSIARCAIAPPMPARSSRWRWT
jgi:CO/xanthine dehydrogenase FAD-binding subunit